MVVDDMKQLRRSHLEGKGVQELPSKRRPRLLNRRFEYSCIAQFNGTAVVKYLIGMNLKDIRKLKKLDRSHHSANLRRSSANLHSRRASFFASRESSKHWGLACPGLATIQARGCGKIRTIISNSTHFTTQRKLHSHTRLPSRNCLHLVLVPLKWSFGILISYEIHAEET